MEKRSTFKCRLFFLFMLNHYLFEIYLTMGIFLQSMTRYLWCLKQQFFYKLVINKNRGHGC